MLPDRTKQGQLRKNEGVKWGMYILAISRLISDGRNENTYPVLA